MPAKIRLARHGKKKAPYYHIVVTDSRAPRDGKYIERIGTYNPILNPAVIDIDFDKALGWLNNGAVPTDTCRAILSYTGVYMKKHLLEGVKKGAFDEATANTRFEEWKLQKLSKIQDKKNKLSKDKATLLKERNEEEARVKEARSQAIAKKLADTAAKERAAAEEAKAEVTAEATATEAPAAAAENQPEA
jgi:small subunit ribosomal protein S16